VIRAIALPLLGLVTLALAFGVWLGVGARPLTETEIIDAAAALYVAETGGAPTDCAARPSTASGVHLVVTCEAGNGTLWAAAYDTRGRKLPADALAQDGEPAT
jgi:hypothetical protein